jgi:hypothetical protein
MEQFLDNAEVAAEVTFSPFWNALSTLDSVSHIPEQTEGQNIPTQSTHSSEASY